MTLGNPNLAGGWGHATDEFGARAEAAAGRAGSRRVNARQNTRLAR